MTIVGHGPTTGRCVLSDRPHLAAKGVTVCEIQSWCPTEDDRLVKGLRNIFVVKRDFLILFV